jgi:hypothetical protein
MTTQEQQQQSTSNKSATKFVHLRTRSNAVAQDKGGYTVAIKARPNGLFSVSICQCNTNQRYDERLGEKVAESRIGRGQFFVQSREELEATLNTLHKKLCTGNVPKLNLDTLNS